MHTLFILYDERCGLCRWSRQWVERQERLLEIVFLAAEREETRRRFPALASDGPPEELTVVSDEGGVYRGSSAWVMVLYALRDYREWSLRLGSPVLLPLARQAFHLLSTHRGALSRWLRLDADEASLQAALCRETAPSCAATPVTVAPGLQTGNPVMPDLRSRPGPRPAAAHPGSSDVGPMGSCDR
jgi:predicted DCC family thiol-disulfide oxidoreductase YuxK